MKFLSRLALDASFQLTIVALLAALTFGLWNSESTTSQGFPSGHRKTCRACASIPTSEVSKFENYLLAHGFVDRARED